MKLLDEVQEKIDEKEFMGIIGKNAMFAVVISGILVGLTYWLVMSVFPWLFGGVSEIRNTIWLIMFVTSVVFCYVFKNEYLDEKDRFDKIAIFLIWIFGSMVYAMIMYFCGEVIVVSLMVLGIVITVLFLATDLSITFILTVREIKQKIDDINSREENTMKAQMAEKGFHFDKGDNP
jgi:hypothetical protein